MKITADVLSGHAVPSWHRPARIASYESWFVALVDGRTVVAPLSDRVATREEALPAFDAAKSGPSRAALVHETIHHEIYPDG